MDPVHATLAYADAARSAELGALRTALARVAPELGSVQKQ